MPKLTWRRSKRLPWMWRDSERGWELHYGRVYKEVASVHPLWENYYKRNKIEGYYWACASNDELGIEHRNTSNNPSPTVEAAQKECFEYVQQCIKNKGVMLDRSTGDEARCP